MIVSRTHPSPPLPHPPPTLFDVAFVLFIVIFDDSNYWICRVTGLKKEKEKKEKREKEAVIGFVERI